MTALERRAVIRAGAHLRGAIRRAEVWVVAEALHLTRGNQALAARILGMGRTTLIRKARQFGLAASPRETVAA